MCMHSAQISKQMAVVLLLFVLHKPISCWNLSLVKQQDKVKRIQHQREKEKKITPSEVSHASPAK